MLCTWGGRDKLPQSLQHGTACKAYYRAWAIALFDPVQGSLACVPGDVVHLYHGSRQNRQYVERYKTFHDHAFDPVRDVEIDPKTGLFQWSTATRMWKPDLVRRVAEYFDRRREDE